MSWFKRSSHASSVNHPQVATPASTAPPPTHDLSKSLCSLNEQLIERLEPEEFFHDPVHVRHYKEEALFLSFMADWEIVEHPQQENFFTADFEEELLHTHTQHNPHTSHTHSQLELELELEQKKLAKPRRKRKLLELIFVENIEMGLVLPLGCEQQLQAEQEEADQRQRQREQQQQVLCKKSKYASSSLSSIASITTTTATCPQQVIKDCRIDRQQLKTEALAGSIMGAIGKCPNTSTDEEDTRQDGNVDPCHPGERNTCDHYDIKQFFHLDDYGNILLNMTHIVECRAAGLALQAQSRRLYRRYRRNCECADEQHCPTHGCCAPLISLLQLIHRLVSGKIYSKWKLEAGGWRVEGAAIGVGSTVLGVSESEDRRGSTWLGLRIDWLALA